MLEAAQTYDQGFRYNGYITLVNPNIVYPTRMKLPVFDCVLTLLPHTYEDTFDIPPVHPIVWLQYLLIVCMAEQMDYDVHHDTIRKQVLDFLKMCDTYREFNYEALLRLRKYVLMFYCIRTFDLDRISLNKKEK